jgi:hypothetical protein
MIDLKIILNVLIALFVYNIIWKAIAATFIKEIMKGDFVQKEAKSFKEKLAEKLKEKENE